jgi:hypothetical protein
MPGLPDHRFGALENPESLRRFELSESFGDHRDIRRADLEGAIAAESAAAPALEVLRLVSQNFPEMLIGAAK